MTETVRAYYICETRRDAVDAVTVGVSAGQEIVLSQTAAVSHAMAIGEPGIILEFDARLDMLKSQIGPDRKRQVIFDGDILPSDTANLYVFENEIGFRQISIESIRNLKKTADKKSGVTRWFRPATGAVSTVDTDGNSLEDGWVEITSMKKNDNVLYLRALNAYLVRRALAWLLKNSNMPDKVCIDLADSRPAFCLELSDIDVYIQSGLKPTKRLT